MKIFVLSAVTIFWATLALAFLFAAIIGDSGRAAGLTVLFAALTMGTGGILTFLMIEEIDE